MTPDVLYLCGPTASGKTSMALEVAREFGGEIVNGDAFQLYRGLGILSAAPTPEERAAVPHHMFGILEPAETSDAQRYVELAEPVIADIQARGRLPIVVGGSGLYLKFLTHGAAPLPRGDAQLRATMEARSLEELAEELTRIDPIEASRTNLKNRRYVSRALEICQLSGTQASALRDQWTAAKHQREAALRGLWITRPRQELHARIARRTAAMLATGAMEEVAALEEVSPTCEKAIGFREIRALLRGEITRQTCEDLINAATRQYAKRQETWFRREEWLEPFEPGRDSLTSIFSSLRAG